MIFQKQPIYKKNFMRISQGKISDSICDFPFLQAYNLSGYVSESDPCLFIGCYRIEDKECIIKHKGQRMILWTGQDALDYDWSIPEINSAIHVTAHPKIFDLLSKSVEVIKIKPSVLLYKKEPQKLGTKIYAYCPGVAMEYHGWEHIQKLKDLGYDVVVGDGRHSQTEWGFVSDEYYNDCFVGLCLSQFAGGAGSAIEMGLRGMNVITNVLDLPNCQKWDSFEDIVYLIERNRDRIGIVDSELSEMVYDSLDHKNEWLNI